MRINVAIPEANVKKPVLDAALEAVTRLNEELIRTGKSPTADQLIAAGAKWKPEKPGDEHFDHGGIIEARGWGDCDDWAPLKAAQLRVTGEDPEARAVVKRSGPSRWHAIVERGDGSEDDPSLDAGMPGPARAVGTRGATLPIMFRRPRIHGVNGAFIATPQLAMRPIVDRDGQLESWQARADLPWHWTPEDSPADLAMASLHQSPVSSQSIVGAMQGLFQLAHVNGCTDAESLKRMSAIAEACEGYSWEDIADAYGPEHATAAGQIVGSFFGKLKRLAKKAVMPLAKTALSFVPGGNLAAAALDMATPALKRSIASKSHAPPQIRPQLAQLERQAERGENINVQLLSRWGDLLARAYEGQRSQPVGLYRVPGVSRPAPRAQQRRPAPRAQPRRQPGAAWPAPR